MDRQRRNFIKLTGLGFTSLYFGGCANLVREERVNPLFSNFDRMSPIDRSIGMIAPRVFSGDQPQRAHQILWAKSAFIAKNPLPKPSEETDLVIVGGGMSGILSAYFLRQHKPILIEQAERFGGNSRGESWQGLDYTLATAYFGVPEEGSRIHRFFSEIDFLGKYRIKTGADPIFIGNKKINDVWLTGTSKKNQSQFVRLAKHFSDMVKGENGLRYPNVPTDDPEERKYINELDQISFLQYVEKVLGEPLDPHLDHVIDHYFWSACSTSHRETSAAMGLNFFVADFDQMAIAKGGNGAIAEAALKFLAQRLPERHFRTSSLVFDVRLVGSRVHVTYVDGGGNIKAISAKNVVMSCPKFIAAKLIDDLEPERAQVIRQLKYRSYVLANVLIDKTVDDQFYDLFFFSEKALKERDLKKAARQQKITDFIHGSYTQAKEPRAVLTFFQGFPYDEARYEILDESYYQKARQQMETQIFEILPKVGLSKNNVVDIRLARWGHPLPLAAVGNIANGFVDMLRKPYRDKIFFIEQDNWTTPSFECVFHEASHFAPIISRQLS